MLKCKFATIRACQQKSNRVDCRVYTVANIFHLLSWVNVNISVKRIYEDQIRPHLSTCRKSGHSNEFPSSKPGEKVRHCQKKPIKCDVFATADFHEYGVTVKIKIFYCLPLKYSLITHRFFNKNAKILASLKILVKTGVLNLQMVIV